MSIKFCNDTSHGGSSYLGRAWRCGRATCGGIQAWRAHEDEARKDVLAELNRWEDNYGLPRTDSPSFRFSFLGDLWLQPRRQERGIRRTRRVGVTHAQRSSVGGAA